MFQSNYPSFFSVIDRNRKKLRFIVKKIMFMCKDCLRVCLCFSLAMLRVTNWCDGSRVATIKKRFIYIILSVEIYAKNIGCSVSTNYMARNLWISWPFSVQESKEMCLHYNSIAMTKAFDPRCNMRNVPSQWERKRKINSCKCKDWLSWRFYEPLKTNGYFISNALLPPLCGRI